MKKKGWPLWPALLLCLGEFNEKIRGAGLLTEKIPLIPEKTLLMAAALGPISIIPHQFLAFSAPSSALFSPISAPFSLISDYFINNVSRPSPVLNVLDVAKSRVQYIKRQSTATERRMPARRFIKVWSFVIV